MWSWVAKRQHLFFPACRIPKKAADTARLDHRAGVPREGAAL